MLWDFFSNALSKFLSYGFFKQSDKTAFFQTCKRQFFQEQSVSNIEVVTNAWKGMKHYQKTSSMYWQRRSASRMYLAYWCKIYTPVYKAVKWIHCLIPSLITLCKFLPHILKEKSINLLFKPSFAVFHNSKTEWFECFRGGRKSFNVGVWKCRGRGELKCYFRYENAVEGNKKFAEFLLET